MQTKAYKLVQTKVASDMEGKQTHLPAWLFWIVGVLLITWFITGQERKGVYFSWYDASMNNSINVNGLRFRLLEDGSLLLTTPTGQYQIHAPGVADLFDLLSAGQRGFLDASSDLPTWPGRVLWIIWSLGDEELPRSLETYREQRVQR